MRAIDKLRAYWSKKERDVMLFHPLGVATKSDASWLSRVFNREFTDELEARGYDVSTMKFEISPKKGEARFSSQRESKTP